MRVPEAVAPEIDCPLESVSSIVKRVQSESCGIELIKEIHGLDLLVYFSDSETNLLLQNDFLSFPSRKQDSNIHFLIFDESSAQSWLDICASVAQKPSVESPICFIISVAQKPSVESQYVH